MTDKAAIKMACDVLLGDADALSRMGSRLMDSYVESLEGVPLSTVSDAQDLVIDLLHSAVLVEGPLIEKQIGLFLGHQSSLCTQLVP